MAEMKNLASRGDHDQRRWAPLHTHTTLEITQSCSSPFGLSNFVCRTWYRMCISIGAGQMGWSVFLILKTVGGKANNHSRNLQPIELSGLPPLQRTIHLIDDAATSLACYIIISRRSWILPIRSANHTLLTSLMVPGPVFQACYLTCSLCSCLILK